MITRSVELECSRLKIGESIIMIKSLLDFDLFLGAVIKIMFCHLSRFAVPTKKLVVEKGKSEGSE